MHNNNKTSLEGWHKNTDLGCNLKTILRSDRFMKAGKDYKGVIRRDIECDEFLFDEHYTFVETEPWTTKRNPRVFSGQYISITRREDGTLRLNFKPRPETMSINYYAFEVYREICNGLNGLVEE